MKRRNSGVKNRSSNLVRLYFYYTYIFRIIILYLVVSSCILRAQDHDVTLVDGIEEIIPLISVKLPAVTEFTQEMSLVGEGKDTTGFLQKFDIQNLIKEYNEYLSHFDAAEEKAASMQNPQLLEMIRHQKEKIISLRTALQNAEKNGIGPLISIFQYGEESPNQAKKTVSNVELFFNELSSIQTDYSWIFQFDSLQNSLAVQALSEIEKTRKRDLDSLWNAILNSSAQTRGASGKKLETIQIKVNILTNDYESLKGQAKTAFIGELLKIISDQQIKYVSTFIFVFSKLRRSCPNDFFPGENFCEPK